MRTYTKFPSLSRTAESPARLPTRPSLGEVGRTIGSVFTCVPTTVPVEVSRAIRYYVVAVMGIVLLAVAASVLYSLVQQFQFVQIVESLRVLSPARVAAAAVVTFVSYSIMTAYDYLGLRYAKLSPGYPKAALVSFVGDSINANAGFSALLGSSIKCRLYAALGLPLTGVVKAIGCYTVAYWLGFCAVGGAALLLGTRGEQARWFTSPAAVLGAALILVPMLSLFGTVFFRHGPLVVGRRTVVMPSVPIAAGLLATACLDWISVAGVLYLLLPPDAGVPFARVLTMFLLAQLGALASQVPGGIAVFETAILLQWAGLSQLPAVTVSLLAFRVIFYLVPFVLSVFLLACIEFYQAAGATRRFMYLSQRFTAGSDRGAA